jgi:hypothetical protein
MAGLPTQVTLPVPAATQPGDTLVAMVSLAGGLVQPPAGWTQIAQAALCSSGYYVAWLSKTAGTEPPSYTFVGKEQATGYMVSGILVSLYGADPSTPVDVTSGPLGINGSAPYSGPSVIATVPGDQILFGAGAETSDDTTWTIPPKTTLVASTGVLVLFAGVAASAGATPILTTAPSTRGYACGAVDVIALRPAR